MKSVKKYIVSIGCSIGILFGTAFIAYAITSLFASDSITIHNPGKSIFEISISSNCQMSEVGPGDNFSISPEIYNDATKEMYVFIVVEQPSCADEGVYTLALGEGWTLISDTAETQVYAYATNEMTVLQPGETTNELTNQMTMRSITNAEYAGIENLDFTIIGYAVGTEGISANPAEAWEQCKAIGNLE